MLTVGSDCAIGKKTVAVELDLAARRRGLQSVFVPTGQTGIWIAGWGIAIDAVVSDFLAGAAERLVVEGAARGGELLWVEGQGSLVHPAYSGVTMGLMHGAAPHAYVLVHKARATHTEGYPDHPIPPLTELIELHERAVTSAPPGEGRRDRTPHRRARGRRCTCRDRPGRGGDGPAGGRSGAVRSGYSPRSSHRANTGSSMKQVTTALACLLTALAAATPAFAELSIGVADDGGKLAEDGGAWFVSQMREAGLQENRITVAWDPDHPATIRDKEQLDRYIATATAAGIRVMILISPNRARALTSSPSAASDFVRFTTQVARAYPQVKEIGVGNEPNQPRFWQPQFSSTGKALACGAYERCSRRRTTRSRRSTARSP